MPTLKLSHSRKATLACIALSTALLAQTSKITPAEARGHIGEQAVVCGSVASTKFAERSKGTPTFINLDRSYPDQIFAVIGVRIALSSDDPRKHFLESESASREKLAATVASLRSSSER
jgi:hypothetical protein